LVRKILISVLVLALIGVCTGVWLWNKPHKKAEDAVGISIEAHDLARKYNKDEKAADSQFLNKVIEVSGTVMEVDSNQDGGIMVILQTDDPAAGVQCAMRDKGLKIGKGHATMKGFCSGNGITGVSLTDCVKK
jgi:putative nucleic acid binding protein